MIIPSNNSLFTPSGIVLARKIKVGDIIVFSVKGLSDPIIHRVIKITFDNQTGKYYFQTKGDHNPRSLPIELNTSQGKIVGVAHFRIPWLGYLKIWFFSFLKLFHLVR